VEWFSSLAREAEAGELSRALQSRTASQFAGGSDARSVCGVAVPLENRKRHLFSFSPLTKVEFQYSLGNALGSGNEVRGNQKRWRMRLQSCRHRTALHFQRPHANFCFRPLVARSGGAGHRPLLLPRWDRLQAAEPVGARGNPYPTISAFWSGDSNPRMKQEFGATIFHQTQSHGPNTRAESIRSPSPHKLAAKVNEAWKELP